ncbi:MAG TPA: condensation domain-containing protein, partial [Thermoanaerobaculia bacterium]|nr:condensation domain-containing protein [Thermoanaerobaculia bacterium]
MSEIFDRVADLSAAKRRLLWQRLSRQGILGEARSNQEPALVPVPRDGRLPLSFAQQRLWFLSQLQPESTAYNLPFALCCEGSLAPALLRRTLAAVVRRHEVLRTTFPVVDRGPVQVIAPPLPPPLPLIDLSALPATARDRETSRLAAGEARTPFDLAQGPLLRAALLRWNAAAHVLLFTMHHMVSDGWSMGILMKEVAELYGSFAAGNLPSLPWLPVQYADFAAWQRRWLSGEELESQLSYWRDRLAGIPPALELPADRPRPPRQSFRGATHVFTLPQQLKAAVESLGRTRGASLFAVLLAAFAALLQRYTGQGDVLIGSPVANRRRLELEGLIGFFVNTLVMRLGLAGETKVAAAVDRAREVVLEAQAHQDLPFDRLVEELMPARSLQGMPLVQVMLALQNAPMHPLELPGLKLSPLPGDGGTAKLDLTLSLVEENGGLAGRLEYSTDLFDPATAVRLAGHYRTLLEAMAGSAELPFSELSLLTPSEGHQLLREWAEQGSMVLDACIHELVAEQAAREPEAVALVCGSARVSYAELDRQASRLASRLRGIGVGPEALVGICAERSVELVVALLATLKAGGAYLPLDPKYPAERLRFMLADAGASVLLARAAVAEKLPAHDARLVLLDEAAEGTGGSEYLATTAGAGPESLAYVMYTSGSTGAPKGVSVRHRGVVRLARDGGFARLGPDEVFLQMAPLSFDASTLEIWGALLNGGRLVIPPPGPLSLEDLGQAIRDQGVTVLWLTAGLFHQMVDHNLEGLRPVRQLLAGGDALSVSHVRRVLQELPGT